MSTMREMSTQNDSGVQDVPTTVDDVDHDMELFNLSVLSDNDLLPDELPHQVSVSASCYSWISRCRDVIDDSVIIIYLQNA